MGSDRAPSRSTLARVAIVVAIVAAAAQAHAAKRSFDVDVQPPGWRADALALTLGADLADDQLALVRASDKAGSGSAAPVAAELGVHVVLEPTVIVYELDARWAGGPAPVHGTIAIGADRIALAAVLRDRMHRMARTSTDTTAEATAGLALPGTPAVGLALLAIAAVLASPFVLVRRRRVEADAAVLAAVSGRDVARAGVRVVISFAIGAGAALLGLVIGGVNPAGALLGAGGLAWGTVLAVTLPMVFPPLVGLGRADFAELGPVLRAWSAGVAVRAVAIALAYGAIGVVAFAVAGADTVAIALVVPVAVLVGRLWLRTIVALLAVRLDGELVDPDADAAAWDVATRNYFVGYFRRNSITVDVVTLDRVQFLPGRGERIECYGGGLVATRIVVPLRVLELALAPWGRPHDYAAPRVSTLHWTQWNAGLVVPSEDKRLASVEDRQLHHLSDEGEYEREPLGEPPTLAGIIEPEDLDPRRSYRPKEDPLWLDWDPGDEHDGTDAGDRDFLFGALVRGLGDVYRGADRSHSLVLGLGWSAAASPAAVGGPRARVHRALGRALAILTKPEHALSNVHAALLGARHHLVQHIAFSSWQREDLVTARAYAPELEATSRQILTTLLALPDAAWTTGPGIEGKRDLAALAPLVRGIPRRARPKWRRFAVAGALAVGASLAIVAVVDAVRYHATYVQRVEKP